MHRGYLRAQKRMVTVFHGSGEVIIKAHDLRYMLATAFRDGAIWMQRSARKRSRS